MESCQVEKRGGESYVQDGSIYVKKALQSYMDIYECKCMNCSQWLPPGRGKGIQGRQGGWNHAFIEVPHILLCYWLFHTCITWEVKGEKKRGGGGGERRGKTNISLSAHPSSSNQECLGKKKKRMLRVWRKPCFSTPYHHGFRDLSRHLHLNANQWHASLHICRRVGTGASLTKHRASTHTVAQLCLLQARGALGGSWSQGCWW